MSVISFLLLISGLKKSKKMVKYNTHEGLNKRMPNYEVRLGMGLHLGYSIEGPLGSYYKIDPTYLSPHVKMSERLESSTKVYGVPLLISEPLYDHLSRTTQSYCRAVDNVIFKGKSEPMMIYTIDVCSQLISLENESEEFSYLSSKEKKIKKVQDRMKRENLREQACKGIF
jgi:class 3 adenylate cyclase